MPEKKIPFLIYLNKIFLYALFVSNSIYFIYFIVPFLLRKYVKLSEIYLIYNVT